MSVYLIWLILALVLLGVEMMLGTIYLLAFVAGAVASCIFAILDFSITTQCTVGSLVIIAGVVTAFLFRRNIRNKLTPNKECDDLDKGQLVFVENVEKDGSAKVNYRGTTWTAYAQDGTLEKGQYKIQKVEGTRLILFK
jgi:membrane protein implicated in regulation of membrane protease activity